MATVTTGQTLMTDFLNKCMTAGKSTEDCGVRYSTSRLTPDSGRMNTALY